MLDEYVKYRIERAKETYDDALLLFKKGSWNSSINRLYYAAFYAAIALLLFFGMEVKSHHGVKRKLGELVISNKFDRENARIFGVLFDLRNKGDYDDLFDFNSEMVENLLKPVELFISTIEEKLNR